jgi:hypothetical protein
VSTANQCSICKEAFRDREFARRCEAQGVPPIVYHVGDILLSRYDPTCLRVVRTVYIHHGAGACPVDGPCEHAVSYMAYRLHPTFLGLQRAWKSSTPRAGLVELRSPKHERVATLIQKWDVIPDDGNPAIYLAGFHIDEEWARFWTLHGKFSSKRRVTGQRRLKIKW